MASQGKSRQASKNTTTRKAATEVVNVLKGAATAAVVAAGETVAQAAMNALRKQEQPANEGQQGQGQQGQPGQQRDGEPGSQQRS
jgi:malate/lactate dehydrogenase